MKKINKIIYFILLIGIAIFSLSLNLNPVNAQTSNYYESIPTNIKGVALKMELRDLITRTHTYRTTYEDCKYKEKINGKTYINPDQDPDNPNNIILFWSGLSIPKEWDGGVTWNREHVWPKSHSWFQTTGAGSDLHHIRPADHDVNSTHNNNPYGLSPNGKIVYTGVNTGEVPTLCKSGDGIFEPGDNRKGDVARIVFYLLTRYSEADSYTVNKSNVATSLDLLLDWNELDPVDILETRRNDAIEQIQGNRNPFIDNENYANLIWNQNATIEEGNNIKINYDKEACNVAITGNQVGNGYKGDVTIKVNISEGYEFINIIDINTNEVISANNTYTIYNINKDYNLKVNVKKIDTIEPPTPPIPTPPLTTPEFVLVNDNKDIKIGDEIIIVGKTETQELYALSTDRKKGNNRGASLIEVINDNIVNKDDFEVITLGKGKLDNTYSLSLVSDITEYLYAGSSTANQLKTSTTLDNNGSWTINIKDGVTRVYANGTNSRDEMQFNCAGNNRLFSCYDPTKPQSPVYIYKKVNAIDNFISQFTNLQTKASMIINYTYINDNYNMNNASLRFGTTIDKKLYDLLEGTNAKWGVEIVKGTANDLETDKAIKIECIPVRVSQINGKEEDINGNYYQFALVLTNMNYIDIDTLATARIYVEINNMTYYMKSSTYSLRSLATTYLELDDKSNFINHLGILEHIKTYK